MPGYPHPLELNQSWWCGYGPYDSPTIVVCALIENGGHGGDAAAPAALRVFQAYFNKQAAADHPPERLVAAGTPPSPPHRPHDPGRRSRARGLRPRRAVEAAGAFGVLRRPDWVLIGGAGAVAYGLQAIDGITKARHRRLGLQRQALDAASAPC